MRYRNILKGSVACLVVAIASFHGASARAFYLGVPDPVKQFFAAVQQVKGQKIAAEIMGPPPSEGNGGGGMMGTPPDMPSSGSGSSGMMAPPPGSQPGIQPGMAGPQSHFGDMQKGAMQMDTQLRSFEFMVNTGEKNGQPVSSETRMKFQNSKEMVDQMKSAKSPEELQNIDESKLEQDMNSLEQTRRQEAQEARQVKQIQQGMRGAEQGLKLFQKQITALEKKGITVPADAKDQLAKATAIVAAVKNAKTLDEILSVGADDLQEIMGDLQESQQTLRMLSQWSQTQKQVDKQLSALTRQLAKEKSIVDRLAKKGVDASVAYIAFEDGVNKLKAARDSAVASVQAGKAEEAFIALQEDFYGQMDDVMQNARVIEMLSNLGNFQSTFKRAISDATRTVARLKKAGNDTAVLDGLLSDAKAKGQEVLDSIKSKEVDADAIQSAMQDLENIKQEFQSAASELGGQPQSLPWQQGGGSEPQSLQLSSGLSKLLQSSSNDSVSASQ